MKILKSVAAALLCVVLVSLVSCSGNAPAPETEAEIHVHSYTVTAVTFDEDNTDYREGERPYLVDMEFELRCECGDSLPIDAAEVICTDAEIARGDTELHFSYTSDDGTEYGGVFAVNTKPVYKVVFAGDSITEGGSGSGQVPYTMYVKKKLRHNVSVTNCGISGISVTGYGGIWNDPLYSYKNQNVWNDVVGSKADLIFVMLGTNDAEDWTNAEPSFDADFEELVASFADTGANVVVLPPPPSIDGNAFGVENTLLEEEIVPREKAIAEKLGVGFFDTYALLKESFPEGSYSDGLHFSDNGKKYFAGIIAEKIREMYGIEE